MLRFSTPCWLLAVAILLLPGLAAVRAEDGARALDQLDLRIWSTDQGLPHNSVLSVAQTADGMLWLGTWAGLARFDGFEFRNFDRDNTPDAIGDSGMLVLAPAAAGGLWVGTHRGGLLRIEDGRIRKVVPVGTSIGGHVLAVLEIGDTLWIGSEGAGLYRMRGSEVRPFVDPHCAANETVSALASDGQGGLLLGTRHGALRLDLQRQTTEAIDLPHAAEDIAVTGVAVETSGIQWLATSQGVYRRATASADWRRLSDIAAASLMVDRHHRAWVGTPSQGVLRIDGERVEQLRVVQGLPDSRVRAVFEDARGGIWLGTNGGLVGLQDLPFRSLGNLQGLSNDYVRSVLETRDGSVWAATARGLNRIRDGKVERFAVEQGLPGESLMSLAEDADGRLWIGTYGDGLAQWRDGTISAISGIELPSRQVRALLFARDGTLWIGTQGGLAHYDPVRHLPIALPVGAPTASAMALHEDRQGRIWVGTSEGLSRFDAGSTRSFGSAQGFPSEAVFSIQDDEQGNIWIGSDAGLVRYGDDRFISIGPEQGLPFHNVLSFQRDIEGNFWLGSGTGIFRVAGADVAALIEGRTKSLGGRLFTRDDGMPSSQCNGASAPASIRLRSGELWFSTAHGIAIVAPNAIDDRPPTPPNVLINKVVIDDVEVALDRPARLGAGRHTIAPQFSAIALTRQGEVDNAYRVRGLDEGWEHVGRERSVRLANLPPGDYTFEVAARFGSGELSGAPARFAFSIAPGLWQRPWFYPLLIAAIILLAFGAYQRRTVQLRRRQSELQRLVREQTAALAREMKVIALRDQENSDLLQQLKDKSRELERLAREDGLTGVFNRRHFDERLREMFLDATARGRELGVLLIDLDNFKLINDSRSHHVGDLVLQEFASLLAAEFVDGVVGRYGGEEFAVALAGVGDDAVRARAEQLRLRVERHGWSQVDPGLQVSISIGVAAIAGHGNADRMIGSADTALYQAKRRGRNRVV